MVSRIPRFDKNAGDSHPICRKLNRGDYRGAIPDLKKELKRDPRNAYAVSAIVVCYQEIGDHRGALEYLKRLTNIEPTNTEAFARQLMILSETGDNTGFQRVLRKAYEQNPGEAQFAYN